MKYIPTGQGSNPPNDSQKVHIGCGAVRLEGWLNCDYIDTPGITDKVFEADGPEQWPFADSSVAAIKSDHCLEHLQHPKRFFQEAWRVSLDNHPVTITVPYGFSADQWGDIHHRTAWVPSTFFFLEPGYAQGTRNPQGLGWQWPFHIEMIQLRVHPSLCWLLKLPAPMRTAATAWCCDHLNNAIVELRIRLRPIKSQWTMQAHQTAVGTGNVNVSCAYVKAWTETIEPGQVCFQMNYL